MISEKEYERVEAHADHLAEHAETLGEPFSRHLGGKVRELRIRTYGQRVRSTYWLASGRRLILLTEATEATAFGVRHNPEALAESDSSGKRLVAVGGGVQGGLWTQIVSDVVGFPREIPTHTFGACYGDALLAGLGAGVVEDTDRC